MKIKIIDLLNLVYEKKAPKKIIYGYCEYEFNYVANDYVNKDGLALFSYLFQNEEQALYKEVEIIEERPKAIYFKNINTLWMPEDPINNHFIDNATYKENLIETHIQFIEETIKTLVFNQEQLIKKVNYLLKKEDDKK